MKRRSTYQSKPTLWELIPNWAYAVFFIGVYAVLVVVNWGW